MKSATLAPLSDPISEDAVKLDLVWCADERTRVAIERQSKLMGYPDPTSFLIDMIAMTLSDYEKQTLQSEDGRLVDYCLVEHSEP